MRYLAVLLFFVSSIAFAATVTWQLPTTNIDGSQLTDLAGIEVCWEEIGNPMSRSNCQNAAADATSITVDVDPSKMWYFAARAFNSAGNFSPWSYADFYPKGLKAAPSKPANVSVQ